MEGLEDESDVVEPVVGRVRAVHVADSGAVDVDGAGGGVEQAGEHLQSRGLARSIGPQEADHLALIDRESGLLNGVHLAVVAGEENVAPGAHTVTWDGRDRSGALVPSGVYFYRIEVVAESGTRFMDVKKMTLIK